MKIRSSRVIAVSFTILLLGTSFYIIRFPLELNGALEYVFLGYFWALLLPPILSDLKVLMLDNEGVTVKFLFYKKKYSWDYFQTKRIQTFAKSLSGEPSVRGAFFSKKKKKTVIMPHHKDLFFPFSFRYVYFATNSKLEGAPFFEVDEKLFREKMEEWGVELIED